MPAQTPLLKPPAASRVKLSANPDMGYEALMQMAEQNINLVDDGIGTSGIVNPVTLEELQSAGSSRDLGSLAAALSGAVRSAGSVGGKLPQDTGFDNTIKDLGNSRMVDLNNRLALRKSQENDIIQSIQNMGIAKQAQATMERRAKPVSEMDRQILNKKLKDFDPNISEVPQDMTYGEIEDNPFLSQISGFGKDTSGLNEYQKAILELRGLEAQNLNQSRTRGQDIQEKQVGLQSKKTEAELERKQREDERRKSPITPAELEVITKGLRARGYQNIPESLTYGDVANSKLYSSILAGAIPTAGQTFTKETQDARNQRLAQSVKAKIDQTNQKVLNDVRQIDSSLVELDRAEQLKKEVGTGLIESNVKGAIEWFKDPADSPRARLQSTVGDALAQYIKGISGAAVSASERSALLANLPTMNDDDNKFMNKLKETRERLKRRRDIIQKEQEYLGKGIPPPPRERMFPDIEPEQPSEFGMAVPTNEAIQEGIPQEAMDRSIQGYTDMMRGAIPYTPKPEQPKRRVFIP